MVASCAQALDAWLLTSRLVISEARGRDDVLVCVQLAVALGATAALVVTGTEAAIGAVLLAAPTK